MGVLANSLGVPRMSLEVSMIRQRVLATSIGAPGSAGKTPGSAGNKAGSTNKMPWSSNHKSGSINN